MINIPKSGPPVSDFSNIEATLSYDDLLFDTREVMCEDESDDGDVSPGRRRTSFCAEKPGRGMLGGWLGPRVPGLPLLFVFKLEGIVRGSPRNRGHHSSKSLFIAKQATGSVPTDGMRSGPQE